MRSTRYYLDIRGKKFPTKEMFVKLLGELEEWREMEILGMERILAIQQAERESYYRMQGDFNATKEWTLERRSFA